MGTGLAVDLADLVVVTAGRREPLRGTGDRDDRQIALGHRPDEEARTPPHTCRSACRRPLRCRWRRASAAVLSWCDTVDDREQHHRHREVVAEQHAAFEHRQLRASASTKRCTGTARSVAELPGSTSSSSEHRRDPCRGRASTSWLPAPDCGMARLEEAVGTGRAHERADAHAAGGLAEIVTLPGSLLNAAMSSRTHSSAAT